MQCGTKRILVGRIAGIHGVKGWLKIMSYTNPRENILQYTPWILRFKETWREVSLQDWKAQHKGLLVALDGIED
ncbi:MAG: ribosome maturation factor RimM, partial [Gammaproteobacteria bacterium]